ALGGQAPTGYPDRNVRGRVAVDLRLERVAQTQFVPGTDRVAQGRPQLGPAVRGEHDVDAVREAAHRQVGDGRLQRLELRPDQAPAVHHEEDVAVRIVHKG